MSAQASNNSGINFFGALFLVFLALKLSGYIDWSWWWVTAPLWLGFVIVIPIAFIYFMYRALKGARKWRR